MRTALLTEKERNAIAAAVAEAEGATGGEIATAIIPESDDYGFRELVASIVFGALAFSVATLFAGPIEALIVSRFWIVEPWMLPVAFGALSLVAGGVFYLLAQIPVIDRVIVPRRVMIDAVGKRSRRHFMESGVYDTRDRTGILIFVSVLERRVELIADRGITAVVPQERWDTIVADLTHGIGRGDTGTALVGAVRSVGSVLAEYVTRRQDDVNEIKDRPDTLEPGS